jgi:hypothetical protein
VSLFIYEENSIQKTGLITHELNREKNVESEVRWAGGIANSLQARDRNVAHSHDGSKPMGIHGYLLEVRYCVISCFNLPLTWSESSIEIWQRCDGKHMMTPAHCDKCPLKEITLWTKEKQLLRGRRYANYYIMFGVQLSYLLYTCTVLKKLLFFTFPFFSLFLNVQSDSFRGVGSHINVINKNPGLLIRIKLNGLHSLTRKWVNQKTNCTIRKCSSRAFQWMVMSVHCRFHLTWVFLAIYVVCPTQVTEVTISPWRVDRFCAWTLHTLPNCLHLKTMERLKIILNSCLAVSVQRVSQKYLWKPNNMNKDTTI